MNITEESRRRKMLDDSSLEGNMKSVSRANILSSISDDKSLLLFNTIALPSLEGNDILISQLKFTRKQYNSRISALLNANLVSRRKNGRYDLTTFGKILYETQRMIVNAVGRDYWKLKAVDALKSVHLSREEYNNIIESLIDDERIKEALII
jgi:predicted transcriptional regulator